MPTPMTRQSSGYMYGDIDMRKGQVYIISVTIIIFMTSLILAAKYSPPADIRQSERIQFMFENMQEELNYVINLIVAEDASSKNIEIKMHNFFSYLEDYSIRKNIYFGGFYFVGLPDEDNLNMTMENFMDHNMTGIKINITNITGSNVKTLSYLDNGNPETLTFDGLFSGNDSIDIEISFDQRKTPIGFSTERKLFQVYELELGRNEDLWVNIVENP